MKKSAIFNFYTLANSLCVALCGCCVVAVSRFGGGVAAVAAVLFIGVNIAPLHGRKPQISARLRVCRHGVECLKAFAAGGVLCVAWHLALALGVMSVSGKVFALSVVVAAVVLTVTFWNGMICVYCASVQLGLRRRVVGLLLGLVPIANLVQMVRIIAVVSREIELETAKMSLDAARSKQRVCATKYPILLVHGVFFRDSKVLNYWGRIPGELKKNGAAIFYGEHHSATSVADSAAELTRRIKDIVVMTGCEKVNIVAHSKGGLDCRYAVCRCGAAPYVASLTTINTPHRGCGFADELLNKTPQKIQDGIADAYNKVLGKIGDSNPDFLGAVRDLTAVRCAELNAEMGEFPASIRTCSVGSLLGADAAAVFPLNLTYGLVCHFDGPNDGLVSTDSFSWGNDYRLLSADAKRGISHADVIDMARENISGFDVREFYVGLVSELKKAGL